MNTCVIKLYFFFFYIMIVAVTYSCNKLGIEKKQTIQNCNDN